MRNLLVFLKLINENVPVVGCGAHSITLDTENPDRLHLSLKVKYGYQAVFIDDGDLDKQPEELVKDILAILPKE